MKSKKSIFISGYLLLYMSTGIIVSGQNLSNTPQSPKPELIERFERVIKNKEPKFKNTSSRYGERLGKFVHSSMTWGIHTDKVWLTISEFDTVADAQKKYANLLEIPTPEPSPTTILANLGDQAFSSISGSEKGGFHMNIFIRSGNLLLSIKSNNFQVAKKFAGHFVREIEKRDKGEP